MQKRWMPCDPKRIILVEDNDDNDVDTEEVEANGNTNKNEVVTKRDNPSSSNSNRKKLTKNTNDSGSSNTVTNEKGSIINIMSINNTSTSLKIASLLSQRVTDRAFRSGSCTIFNLGVIQLEFQYFHNEYFIFPHKFRSSRIFWSMTRPWQRTLYIFEILSDADFNDLKLDVSSIPFRSEFVVEGGLSKCNAIFPADIFNLPTNSSRTSSEIDYSKERPIFRVIIADNPDIVILSRSLEDIYSIILSGVRSINHVQLSTITIRQTYESYGLSAGHFFGLSLPFVRHAIELRPESVTCILAARPLPQYKPCYVLPSTTTVRRIQGQQAQLKDNNRMSKSGCARGDVFIPRVASANSQGTRITKILTKVAGSDKDQGSKSSSSSSSAASFSFEFEEDRQDTYREIERNKYLYSLLSSAYIRNSQEKLIVRRSSIHGCGLFARVNFDRNDMIVEYIGEKIRQVVADRRESIYEAEGVGSCYLFRLDKDIIVDATRTGGMARFINHCCEPNAYARIIATDNEQLDKHIIIFAGRDIEVSIISRGGGEKFKITI